MTLIDAGFIVLGLNLATALAARKLSTPEPVLYAIVGLVAGVCWHLVPGLPIVRIPPELVLFAFLPPLLTTAAYGLPLRAFRRHLGPISLLAVGLVLASIGVAAWVGHAVAGLPWALAFAFGAVVAPPDPVAATAVAGRMGLPHRLTVVLEGEGLVNDAVAIVAFGLAIKAVVTGHFNWLDAVEEVLRETPIGVATGLAVGWAAQALRRAADNVPLEVGISLVTPYLAYYFAEKFSGSGVLAVVSLGFLLRHHAVSLGTPTARLAARTVWGAVRFITTGLVFLLLGLLIGEATSAWPGLPIIRAGAAVALSLVLLRLAWVWAMPGLVPRRRKDRRARANWAERTVLGWAGMRGVVSLALALSLPITLEGELRRTVLFLTFSVIVATLVVQGLLLMPLVRWLGAGDPERDQRDECRARADARRAGVAALRKLAARQTDQDALALCEGVDAEHLGIADPTGHGDRGNLRDPALAVLEAQRRAVDRLRDAGHLGESLTERLDTELDLAELDASGEGSGLTSAPD